MNICCALGYFEPGFFSFLFFLIQGHTKAAKVDTHPDNAVQDQSVVSVTLASDMWSDMRSHWIVVSLPPKELSDDFPGNYLFYFFIIIIFFQTTKEKLVPYKMSPSAIPGVC